MTMCFSYTYQEQNAHDNQCPLYQHIFIGVVIMASWYGNAVHIIGPPITKNQGPILISDKTSYCKTSQSLEGAWFVFRIVRSLWNLTCTSSAPLLLVCLSNFIAMRWLKPLSQLRGFARSHDKTSYRILKQGPGGHLNKKDGLTRYGDSHIKDKTS